MGGGPSSEQKAAAAQQAQLSSVLRDLGMRQDARETQGFNLAFPFAQSRISNGLPFYNSLTDYDGGTQARAAAQGRAALNSQLQNSVPSNRAQALADFEAQRARNYDDSMKQNMLANETSKQEGARLITGQQQIANPLGYFGASSNANSSIMNAPLQSPGMAGAIGGAVGGLAGAIPL